MATKKKPKANPSWSDVKTRLDDFGRAGLLGLVHNLYAASKDNKAFLHTRFGLVDHPLDQSTRLSKSNLGQQGEKGNQRLQKGAGPARGLGRTHGILLRGSV